MQTNDMCLFIELIRPTNLGRVLRGADRVKQTVLRGSGKFVGRE